MSSPFGGFLPSEPEPADAEPIDGEFEEVASQPVSAPVPPVPPVVLDETVPDVVNVDAETVPNDIHDDVAAYRQRLGLISPETMAHIIGIHVDTLKLWRRDGRGPNYLRVGKRIWYYFDLVQEWLPSTRERYTEKATTGVSTGASNVNTEKGLRQDARPEEPERERREREAREQAADRAIGVTT